MPPPGLSTSTSSYVFDPVCSLGLGLTSARDSTTVNADTLTAHGFQRLLEQAPDVLEWMRGSLR